MRTVTPFALDPTNRDHHIRVPDGSCEVITVGNPGGILTAWIEHEKDNGHSMVSTVHLVLIRDGDDIPPGALHFGSAYIASHPVHVYRQMNRSHM